MFHATPVHTILLSAIEVVTGTTTHTPPHPGLTKMKSHLTIKGNMRVNLRLQTGGVGCYKSLYNGQIFNNFFSVLRVRLSHGSYHAFRQNHHFDGNLKHNSQLKHH